MEIELENIVTPNREIGEGKGFYADLYINGIRAGQTKNEGTITVYRPENQLGAKLIEEADNYYQSQPGEIMTLSWKINSLFLWHEAIVQQKEVQYYKPGMEAKSIIVFDAEINQYRKLELKLPIADLNRTANAEKTLFRIFKEFIIPYLKAADVVVNKNLPVVVGETMTKYCKYLTDHPTPFFSLSK